MGEVRNIVKKNFSRDSVQLLHVSEEAKKIDGIRDAAIVMGTATNKEILGKLGLLTEEGRAASANDMILALMTDSPQRIEKAAQEIEQIILKPTSKGQEFYSVDSALDFVPDANLAIVSIPGGYAREVVLRLLGRGLSVLLFSDHVPPEHELELKQYARQKGLLLMGPGAGTAIIGGKAIAFANAVKKGNIGVVTAAGTGLQEVSVLLSEAGLGVSAGLGTGGGDVKGNIGGLMTLQSVDTLEADPETSTILLVSKPPDPNVKKLIIEYMAKRTKKRYVICFLDSESFAIPTNTQGRLRGARTLHAGFLEAIRNADSERYSATVERFAKLQNEMISSTTNLAQELSEKQRYVRGLYTGGTLAYETIIILSRIIGEIHSNAPLDPKLKLADSYRSAKHSILDLGEEEFTLGRAHPMIDPTIRKLRLVEEARDPEVAVIMMDFMLGYGSHPDPAGAMLSAIIEARKIAEIDGRPLPVLAHVCGTELDPQPLSEQTEKLRNVGVHVYPTNALMAIASALISRRGDISNTALPEIYRDFLTGFE